MNRIIALDAYNGAFLWLLAIADLRRANLPRDAANWCTDSDHLYVAVNGECWVLDSYTGRRTSAFQLPDEHRRKTHDWGYVANEGDKLFGSSVKKGSVYVDFWGSERWNDGKGSAGDGTDKVCSDDLFAYDKKSRKRSWVHRNGVIINTTIAVSDGRVCFVACRNPEMKAVASGRQRLLSAKDRRRGRTDGVAKEALWQDQYLVALDSETGSKLWEQRIDTVDGLVVFYLGCAEGRIVIASSAHGEDHLYVFDAVDGRQQWHASQAWTRDNHGAHSQHPAVVGSTVYQVPCAYDLKSGKLLTDQMMGGKGTRKCGTYAATAGALIYRGRSLLSMWDMKSEAESNWPRLRSSCWLSTIPAAGMLLSPEGGGGCSCGHWMETSLGFAPRLPIEGGSR